MGRMKTLYWVALTCMCLPAFAKADDGLLKLFAECTGRLSAQVEHYWLLGDPRSEQAVKTRADLIEIVESVSLTPSDDVRAMAVRLDAKVAQAQLLRHATFNSDASSAAWSARRAGALVAGCVALVSHNRPDAQVEDNTDSIN